MGIRTTSVAIQPCLGALGHAAILSALLPQFPDQAHQSLGPDPQLEGILLYIESLDEQMDSARLLGSNGAGLSIARKDVRAS